MLPFLVCEFHKATLSNLIKECFGSNFLDVLNKQQIDYIYNYLYDLDAKSILLERDYVDSNYLEDYSKYYVKCFNRYGGRCARLHFFSDEVDHARIESVFNGREQDKEIERIQGCYLGFMVVKPIPQTFIGKTCLKVYDSLLNPSEKYKCIITKKYTANLYGISLSVDSIAFQEQDRIIAACATTAIWSVLHALPWMDSKNVPSPSEITLAAINHIKDSSNSFPNDGLNSKQILRALDTYGLRHHSINLKNTKGPAELMEVVRPYIDSNVPLILGTTVYDLDEKDDALVGRHAVAVLGYSNPEKGCDKTLYIHDDGIGPYCRGILSTIGEAAKESNIESADRCCLVLQEKNDDGSWKEAEKILTPDHLIVPTHKKVRISADGIDNTCRSILDEFDEYVDGLKNKGKDVSKFEEKLTYSVSLQELSDIRRRVLGDDEVINKRNVLTKSSPRFIWVANFLWDNRRIFEIHFDATDIPQGHIISNIVIYDKKYYKVSTAPFKRLYADGHSVVVSERDYINAFILYNNKHDYSYDAFLDETYGELRAPAYLKEGEIEKYHENMVDRARRKESYIRDIKESLDSAYPDLGNNSDDSLIWVIVKDGALLIGEEVDGLGHPSLTGFQSARIAGELRKDSKGWFINAKSGRYSQDYEDSDKYLFKGTSINTF